MISTCSSQSAAEFWMACLTSAQVLVQTSRDLRLRQLKICRSFNRLLLTRSDWCRFRSVRTFKIRIQIQHTWAKLKRSEFSNSLKRTTPQSRACEKERWLGSRVQ